jgi:glucose-1-phosphate cytidylyltransferase
VLDTGQATNTGGRIKRAASHLDEDNFMVTYGDGLGNVDLRALLDFHKSHGRLGTATVVRPPLRFGVIDLHDDNTVVRFREKPQSEDWVSAGFFVFRREFLELLDLDSVLETTPLEKLAEAQELMAFRHEGFWQPMDTYRELEMLSQLWEGGEAPWKTWPD